MNEINSKNNILSAEKADFGLIVADLLENLSDRAKEILVSRFGLDDGKPKSLGFIGKKFKITRERVRQIEADSFKKLKKISKNDVFKAIEEKALDCVKENGGFCEKGFVKEKIKPGLSENERRQLMLILNSSSGLKYKRPAVSFGGFWYDNHEVSEKEIFQAHKILIEIVGSSEKNVSFDEIFKKVSENDFFKNEKGKERLKMVLRASRLIQKNILNEWGMKNWRTISGRGSREKAFLVLKKHEEPLHFREITDLINKYWLDKRALPQTVHNELIKDERFVQVGKGTYGLSEWGFSGGTVRDIIVELLKNSQVPVSKEEIVEHVMNQKRVKKTTVVVNLTNHNFFIKKEEGYLLKK